MCSCLTSAACTAGADPLSDRVREFNRGSFGLKLLADCFAVSGVVVPAEVCWMIDALLPPACSRLHVHVVMRRHVLSFQPELKDKHALLLCT